MFSGGIIRERREECKKGSENRGAVAGLILMSEVKLKIEVIFTVT
jgi:hypothetical protein